MIILRNIVWVAEISNNLSTKNMLTTKEINREIRKFHRGVGKRNENIKKNFEWESNPQPIAFTVASTSSLVLNK